MVDHVNYPARRHFLLCILTLFSYKNEWDSQITGFNVARVFRLVVPISLVRASRPVDKWVI